MELFHSELFRCIHFQGETGGMVLEDFSKRSEGEKELFGIVRKRAVVGAFLIYMGIFIVQIMVYAVIMLVMPFFLQSGTEVSGLLRDAAFRHLLSEIFALAASVCYIIWCGFLYARSDWRKKADYKKVFCRHHLVQIFCAGFGGCFCIIVVLTVLQQVFPAFFADYQKGMDEFNTGSVRMFVYTLVLGPVAEELMFRGAIFDRLYLAFPFHIANFLQAALFAVYHRNLIQGIYAFLFGLLLGLIHHTGGSIWNNILAHILFNVTNFLVPVLYRMTAEKSMVWLALMAAACFAGFFYGAVGLVKEAKRDGCE